MKSATFRVRDEPFYITGRGVAVICDVVGGDAWYGAAATVALPAGSGAEPVLEVAVVESARVDGSERPGLVFRAERGSNREVWLRDLLRPGSLLTLTEPRERPAPPDGAGR